MRRRLLTVCIFYCTLLCACDDAAMMKRYAPLQDEPVARKYLDLLLQKKTGQLQQDLNLNVADVDPAQKLRDLVDDLPVETPISVKVVGAREAQENDVRKVDFTYECEFENAWYLVEIALQKKDNLWTILGLHDKRLADSLENLNKFTLWDKGLNQYVVLLLAFFSLALSLYSLILCIRTRTGPSRWMWASIILIGVGHLAVNWTTGELIFPLFAIHVPPARATAAFYGPWFIGFSLPFGALVFLNERWRGRVLGEPAPDREANLAMETLRKK
jgi:hypothetical protein